MQATAENQDDQNQQQQADGNMQSLSLADSFSDAYDSRSCCERLPDPEPRGLFRGRCFQWWKARIPVEPFDPDHHIGVPFFRGDSNPASGFQRFFFANFPVACHQRVRGECISGFGIMVALHNQTAASDADKLSFKGTRCRTCVRADGVC